MSNKATIPFWSADAFLYFVMPRSYISAWSSELVSRVSSFVDAYVLFDKVVLPERYKKYSELKVLDPDNTIFEYISSECLNHSDDLIKGVTIDLSMDLSNIDTLMQEDYKWFSQHNGNVSRSEYDSLIEEAPLSMAYLRLWQLGLLNEISDYSKSVSILPLSLQGLESADSTKKRHVPFHVDRISDLDKHLQGVIKAITANTGEFFVDYLENVPPLFTLLVDQALSHDHAIEVLRQLRSDFCGLRELNGKYNSSIEKAGSLRDKKDVIDEWNASWHRLIKGDFKKPQLLRKKVSSSDVSKSIIKPGSSGISTIIQMFLDYREDCQSYKRFKIFSELYNELDGISGARSKIKSKFSVDLVNEL
ncbi:hypothetical protein [Acidithiobacillus ferrianus]|uniref:hypothetical protein n=1 Tax=Acidithiobacillus ferrianus TaxID=2678518 RepID=UPI0034E5B54D